MSASHDEETERLAVAIRALDQLQALYWRKGDSSFRFKVQEGLNPLLDRMQRLHPVDLETFAEALRPEGLEDLLPDADLDALGL